MARIGALLDLVQPDAEQMPVDWPGRGLAESSADSARAALRGRAVTPSRTGRPATPARRRTEASEHGRRVRGCLPGRGPTKDSRPQPTRPSWFRTLCCHLHLDTIQHGLGTAACGPGVLPGYVLHSTPVRLALWFTVG